MNERASSQRSTLVAMRLSAEKTRLFRVCTLSRSPETLSSSSSIRARNAGEFGFLLDNLDIVSRARLFAAPKLATDFLEIVRKLPVILMRKMRIEYPEIFHQGLVTTGLGRLTLERADLPADLFDDILNTEQVRLRVFEFAERLFLLSLVFRYSRGFLKDRAAVFRPAAQDQVDLPLLHDRVGASAHARIHEKLVDIAQPARPLVEKILTLAVAINAPGDANLIPFDAQVLFRTRQKSAKLRPFQALACCPFR